LLPIFTIELLLLHVSKLKKGWVSIPGVIVSLGDPHSGVHGNNISKTIKFIKNNNRLISGYNIS
jgi:hypothetical protein